MSNSARLLLATVFILIYSQLTFSGPPVVKATFAGGCYWCMEEAFESVDGVVSVISGFSGNIEAVEIEYEPEKLSYETLLDVFWRNIDPTDSEGQFCDRGPQYISAIFYHTEYQKTEAEKSKLEIESMLHKQVVTPVIRVAQFVPVAESHQDYYRKNAFQYKQYKMRCGRDRRLRSLWKQK